MFASVIPSKAVWSIACRYFSQHFQGDSINDEELSFSACCRKDEMFLLGAEYPTCFRASWHRCNMVETFTIDNLHCACCCIGDENVPIWQIDITVVEITCGTGWQIDVVEQC